MTAITCERHEAVALITINRPEAVNALDFVANDEVILSGDRLGAEEAYRIGLVNRILTDTEDLAEGTRAFAEKRAPVLRGR